MGKGVKPSLSSGGDSEACVLQMGPSPLCAEMMRVRVSGLQGGFLWTTKVHQGARGSMMNEGSMLVTLNFDWGALSCTITALLSLYTHPSSTFWRASGSFSDQWNTTRQQWPHWTSVASAWLCPLNPPGFHSCHKLSS